MLKKNKPTRIMVFGTFDILHQGHLNFFQQARKLSKNPYLIVSLARDINVKKIKGSLPENMEKARLAVVKQSALVDKAVLGNLRNYLSHIKTQKPQIIALGYDQTAYIKGLQEKLAKIGLKVELIRLKSFKPSKYKSSFFKKTAKFEKV